MAKKKQTRRDGSTKAKARRKRIKPASRRRRDVALEAQHAAIAGAAGEHHEVHEGSWSPPPYTIVGIGASAGGLEACSQLLGAIEPGAALALVIVHHLSPKHESALPELLGQHSRMPRAAIATGMVDLILPPEEIAVELMRIGRQHQTETEAPSPSPESLDSGDPALSRIFELLRDSSGVDFTHYKLPTIRRRLNRR